MQYGFQRFCAALAVCVLSTFLSVGASVAADDDTKLADRQSSVAQRYQRLEELLLRLAEVEGAENPERAALLRRAAKQSRDQFVLNRMRTAAESLKTQEFQKAVESQEGAQKELSSLLKLLLSEDRSKRIRDEKERYTKLLKDLKRNYNSQRSATKRTENQADLDEVLEEQEDVTERSKELKDRLAEQNDSSQNQQASESESPSEQSQSSESEQDGSESEQNSGEKNQGDDSAPKDSDNQDEDPKDGDPKDNNADDSDPKEKDPKDSDNQDSENKDGSDQKPSDSGSKTSDSEQSESKPSDSESQESQSQQSQSQSQESQSQSQSQSQQSQQQSQQQQSQQQSQQQQPQTPEQEVEQRLKEAIEKMEQAQEELENAKREEATERQREAEEKLREAIDRLERILRQLREEEMLRELAKLEARLRKMAAMQTKVLDDTIVLAATPRSQRNRQTDLKAGDLAFEEKKITLEADRAMLLLREEGSSVAFPEVVSQIRSDTTRVSEMLGQTKIDAVCQGVQQDILAALEEMIDAVQKAQRDIEQRQQQQQGQPQQGGSGEQPLVEALAELKLIRTMEVRIKSTTDRYAGLLEAGDSSAEEIFPLLQDLSERQNRLYRITRDLVSKRNQ